MDQTTIAQTGNQQPQGGFYVSVNKRKQPGDRQPTFQGNLQIPGTNKTFGIALWGHEYADQETGEMRMGFNGNTSVVSRNTDPEEQLTQLIAAGKPNGRAYTENNLTVEPGRIAIFANKFREQSIAKGKDAGKDVNPPHFWGRWNPGNGEPVVHLSIWQSTSKVRRNYGEVILTGWTQYPQPANTLQAQLDSEAPYLESENPAPAEDPSARRRGSKKSVEQEAQQEASFER